MREKVEVGGVQLAAYSGNRVVFLAWSLPENKTVDLLAFGLSRTTPGSDKIFGLKGAKGFDDPELSKHFGDGHPLQTFSWGDYSALDGTEYTYTLKPVYRKDGVCIDGEPLSITICTENSNVGTHAVFFNRGAAGSQMYSKKFQVRTACSSECRTNLLMKFPVVRPTSGYHTA